MRVLNKYIIDEWCVSIRDEFNPNLPFPTEKFREGFLQCIGVLGFGEFVMMPLTRESEGQCLMIYPEARIFESHHNHCLLLESIKKLSIRKCACRCVRARCV